MKDKSPKRNKGSSLNESSSTFVEPSLSKITIRNKGHKSSLEMSDIRDEMDSPYEGLNQSTWTEDGSEYPKGKKKKKKKRKPVLEELSDSYPEELNEYNEYKGLAVVNVDKNKPAVEQGAAFTSKDLNCSVSSSDNPNVHKKKKKKKAKTHSSDEHLYELNLSEGLKDADDDENKAESDLESGLELNQSPVKKIKTKHCKSRSAEEEPEVNSLHEEKTRQPKRNDERFSEKLLSSVDSPRTKYKRKHPLCGQIIKETGNSINSPLLQKKKKKTHKLLEESNLNISDNEQFQNDRRDTDNDLLTVGNDLTEMCTQDKETIKKTLHKKKKKTHKLLEESILNISHNEQLQNDRRGTDNDLLTVFNDLTEMCTQDTETITKMLHKKKKKTHKLLEESNLNISDTEQFQNDRRGTDNDLLTVGNDLTETCTQETETIKKLLHKKKKKTHKLLKESNLNISDNEQFQNDRCAENNEIKEFNDINISQSLQSAKKLKMKHKSSSINSITLDGTPKNKDRGKIKSSDTEFSPHDSKIIKRRSSEGVPSEVKPSALVSDSHKSKHEDSGKIENNGQEKEKRKMHKNPFKSKLLRKSFDLPNRDNNRTLEERGSNHLESLGLSDSEIPQLNSSGPDSRENEHENKNKGDHRPKKNNPSEDELRTKSAQTLPYSKDLVSTGPCEIKHINKVSKGKVKDVKKKEKIKDNIESLRMRLLSEAFSGAKKPEGLLPKSTKPKTDGTKNLENLRMQLLKEAFSGTEESEDLPKKSIKPKKDVDNNLKSLVSKVEKDKKEFHKDSKDKIRKDKQKHKLKKHNDIDKLTDILISKALEKVTSSCGSHSSQENINVLNVAKEGLDLNKCRKTKNKTVKVKQHKSELSETLTVGVKEQGSEDKCDRDQIQKSLLTEALKTLHAGFKSSKHKLKSSSTSKKS